MSTIYTIHLNDGGDGGSFTPSSIELSLDAPSATFTYTPATGGPKTISVTNDGGLTNPASIAYEAAYSSFYTLSGPGSGVTGVASTDFTVALPVGGVVAGTVTVTPNDGAAVGVFTPTSVALTTASPSATFTYTPSADATATINVTNDGGLTDPAGVSYVSSTSGFDPTTIAGLKAWWKADVLALADGDPVSSWTDSSGLANHATQATGGSQPLFKTNIINTKPVLRFDGTDDYMGATMLGSVTTATSVFLVQKQFVIAGNRTMLSLANDPTNSFAVYLPYLDNNVYWDFGNAAGGSGRISGAWGGDTTNFFVWSFIAGGGDMAVYRNGTSVVAASGKTNSFNPAGLTLSINGSGAGTQQADTAEILIYNTALGTTDREAVEDYLMTKYGL